MTPQEQYDYKRAWLQLDNHAVPIHSDNLWKAKLWVRENIDRTQYSFRPYTDIYEHTYYFEISTDVEEFKKLYAYNKTI